MYNVFTISYCLFMSNYNLLSDMRLEILHLLMALYSLELMMLLFRPFVIVAELWNVWPVKVLFSFCQCAPVMWQSCGMCGGPGWSQWV